MIGNLIVITRVNTMRKIIGYLLSWLFFWLGHWISRPMYRWDCFAWLYPAYNNLMGWSYDIQEWADNNSPWKKVD